MKQRKPIAWVSRRTRKCHKGLLAMTATHILSALFGVLFALGTR